MRSIFNIISSGQDKAPYFLGMIMLIRVLGALTQTNEWVGKLQTLVRDPLGQFVFLMAKYYILYRDFLI